MVNVVVYLTPSKIKESLQRMFLEVTSFHVFIYDLKSRVLLFFHVHLVLSAARSFGTC